MKKFSVSKMLLALSAIALVPSACQQDEMPETVGGLPEDGVTFQWNEVDSRTVTVEASAEWSFEEIDEDDIIDVVRPEGTNELVITPKGMNYSLDTHSATVRIVVGSGSTAVESSISVSQGANTKTYLTFLDEDLSGDNPIIQFPSALGGEPAVREILISTNNVLSVDVSSNQDIDITTGTEGSEEAMTKVQLPGEYVWMSYEISQRETDEGVISVLTLTSQVNQSLTETLTVAIDVVSGSEDINNEVVTRRIALVSLPSTPAIVINPSDLVFAYDAAEFREVGQHRFPFHAAGKDGAKCMFDRFGVVFRLLVAFDHGELGASAEFADCRRKEFGLPRPGARNEVERKDPVRLEVRAVAAGDFVVSRQNVFFHRDGAVRAEVGVVCAAGLHVVVRVVVRMIVPVLVIVIMVMIVRVAAAAGRAHGVVSFSKVSSFRARFFRLRLRPGQSRAP